MRVVANLSRAARFNNGSNRCKILGAVRRNCLLKSLAFILGPVPAGACCDQFTAGLGMLYKCKRFISAYAVVYFGM